ncbi:hypothetical protein BU23DRAFT_269783 [Bimuria novae-zelandiae CBS 107.79]|uniref:Rhodopsin domain-containing protein n=1 Tax=Bimuria novae-zelandiae CBS 107.79 TaxID=1447943 RepID=A0A6A5UVT3_9PLEO|nr:hypothetical protein BU23DRAFT_269783 [Bimuria novae-zelandiae CBS 107.79]
MDHSQLSGYLPSYDFQLLANQSLLGQRCSGTLHQHHCFGLRQFRVSDCPGHHFAHIPGDLHTPAEDGASLQDRCGLMFALGTFGCIATFIRLQSLLTFKTTIDPTWDYVPITIWSEVELSCAFACVSLPAIRILLVKMFLHSIFSSANRSRNTTNPTTPQIMYPKSMPQAIPAQVKAKRQSV